MATKSSAAKHRAAGAAVSRKQKRLQAQMRLADARHRSTSKKKPAAAPAGGKLPKSPFPPQHQDKPGLESKLRPKPQFLAPNYQGSGKLKDKVAIVTGGDSGIGRAVAVLFAREGAKVSIVYLDETDDAEETASRIEAEGSQGLLLQGDVSDFSFCRYAIKETIKAFGQLDILVNNAAFQLHAANLADLTEEHFDLTMKTNVYGYFHMAKAALPHLLPGSAIINTGSETGFFGSEELLDYSATKGAIHAFTRSLAKNLLPKGIRVNAVAPGPVWTPLNPSDRDAKDVAKFGMDSDMKRPAQPEEISPAFVFLAAPCCSSYITGTVIPVFGGAATGG